MKSSISSRVFWLLLALLGWSSGASAGFAQASLPGLSVTSGGYSYTGTAAAQAANGGQFYTAATVNAAGKAVQVPAAMRFAANAGQFAVGLVRLNPAAIAVSVAAAWLVPYGIEWVNDEWQYTGQQQSSGINVLASGIQYIPDPEGGTACNGSPIGGQTIYFNGTSVTVKLMGVSTDNYVAQDGWSLAFSCSGSNKRIFEKVFNNCSSGMVLTVIPTGGSSCVVPAPAVPVTEAQWNAVAADPLPVPVAQEVAAVYPMPVQAPQLEPVVEPISEPYKLPDGTVVRDIVSVIPAPLPLEPTRVEVKTGTELLDPATETPITDQDIQLEKPDPFCTENPDASACKPLGTPADPQVLPIENIDTGIQPESVGGAGSCPAAINVSFMGKPLTFSWELICQFAGGIRPIVIGLAWFFAGSAFLFGAKRYG